MLAVAGAAAPGESPIVEETARSARHGSSHSELSQQQSPQQSQPSLTAAVAGNLLYSRNQPVYHMLSLSRGRCLSFLCVLRLLVNNQTDLSKFPFAIPRQVQVTTRVDLIGQRAITPNFFRTYKTRTLSCLDNSTRTLEY